MIIVQRVQEISSGHEMVMGGMTTGLTDGLTDKGHTSALQRRGGGGVNIREKRQYIENNSLKFEYFGNY